MCPREREREREREARGEIEGSEEISMNILHVLPATRESSRKILIEEIFPKKGGDWSAFFAGVDVPRRAGLRK